MTATEQSLYDKAIALAYDLAKGSPINPASSEAKAFVDAAIATSTTDLSKTLRAAAESVT